MTLEKITLLICLLRIRQDRGDGFRAYRSPHKNGEFTAVVNMCHLEADNQSEAEAGDTD